jgi:hypothetical protein
MNYLVVRTDMPLPLPRLCWVVVLLTACNFAIAPLKFYISYSIETITLGDKRIGIRTSVLEEKATACNMLCCYADELKEGFFPWIDQVYYPVQ